MEFVKMSSEEWAKYLKTLENDKEVFIYGYEDKKGNKKIAVVGTKEEQLNKNPIRLIDVEDKDNKIKHGIRIDKKDAEKMIDGKDNEVVNDPKLYKEVVQSLLIDELKLDKPNNTRLKKLKDLGADFNKQDEKGNKPIYYAMDKKEEVGKDLYKTMRECGMKVDVETVKVLKDNGKIDFIRQNFDKNLHELAKENAKVAEDDSMELSIFKKPKH